MRCACLAHVGSACSAASCEAKLPCNSPTPVHCDQAVCRLFQRVFQQTQRQDDLIHRSYFALIQMTALWVRSPLPSIESA